MDCEFKPSTDRKFSCLSTSSHTSHPAHVDYPFVVSPGKLTHSQAKVNNSRRNSHIKFYINRFSFSQLSHMQGQGSSHSLSLSLSICYSEWSLIKIFSEHPFMILCGDVPSPSTPLSTYSPLYLSTTWTHASYWLCECALRQG